MIVNNNDIIVKLFESLYSLKKYTIKFVAIKKKIWEKKIVLFKKLFFSICKKHIKQNTKKFRIKIEFIKISKCIIK